MVRHRSGRLDSIEYEFYHRWMLRPEQDRLTRARIHGVITRHVRTGPLTGARQAAALADLAEVASGRVDLLAEHAGVALGFHEDDLDAALHQRGAQLCITAGADIAKIDHWIDE